MARLLVVFEAGGWRTYGHGASSGVPSLRDPCARGRTLHPGGRIDGVRRRFAEFANAAWLYLNEARSVV